MSETSLESAATQIGHYISAFTLLGCIVVAAYAWQRFNEPTFTNQDTLPRAMAPLRYLFLRSSYRRARFIYTFVSLVTYSILVWAGPTVLSVAGVSKDAFPREAWPLVVALLLVGLVPNSNVKWITIVEEQLRRWVHEWFLVPHGILKTIGVLEDANYDPPSSQLNAISVALKERLQHDLGLPRVSLRYRWARASILLVSLRQVGADQSHPLRKDAFEPFKEDFESINERYRSLKQDIEPLDDRQLDADIEDKYTGAVERLLTRIYAYISWGIRHQADSKAVQRSGG